MIHISELNFAALGMNPVRTQLRCRMTSRAAQKLSKEDGLFGISALAGSPLCECQLEPAPGSECRGSRGRPTITGRKLSVGCTRIPIPKKKDISPTPAQGIL